MYHKKRSDHRTHYLCEEFVTMRSKIKFCNTRETPLFQVKQQLRKKPSVDEVAMDLFGQFPGFMAVTIDKV